MLVSITTALVQYIYTANRVLLFNLSVKPEGPSLHLQHSAIDNTGDGRGGGGGGRVNFSVPKGPDGCGRGRRGLEWVRWYMCFPNSSPLALGSTIAIIRRPLPCIVRGDVIWQAFKGNASESPRHLDASLRIMEIDTRRTLGNYAPIFLPPLP